MRLMVASVITKYTPTNTMNTAGALPMPNRKIDTGSQAIGEIGASSVSVGSTSPRTTRNWAIRVPVTRLAANPRDSPASTRSSVARMVVDTATSGAAWARPMSEVSKYLAWLLKSRRKMCGGGSNSCGAQPIAQTSSHNPANSATEATHQAAATAALRPHQRLRRAALACGAATATEISAARLTRTSAAGSDTGSGSPGSPAPTTSSRRSAGPAASLDIPDPSYR